MKDPLQYVHSTSFISDSGENVVGIVFLCEYEAGIAFAKSPDEVEMVKWMTSQEILSHPKAPVYLKESIKLAESLIKNESRSSNIIKNRSN